MKNDDIFECYCDVRLINSWDDVISFYKEKSENLDEEWIFRGHKCCEYRLSSSLERSLTDLGVSSSYAFGLEKKLLREFKGCLHLFEQREPESNDTLEWWAKMQHYGAPTRLLDWSYSFFVALYFALEKASDKSDPAAVWAVESKTWTRKANEMLAIDEEKPPGRNPEIFNEKFFPDEPAQEMTPCVLPVNPLRLNRRLMVQQGIFLCPSESRLTFEENLFSLITNSVPKPVKLIVNCELKKEGLKHLYRMNITRASLFPGLQGFSESLGIYFPKIGF